MRFCTGPSRSERTASGPASLRSLRAHVFTLMIISPFTMIWQRIHHNLLPFSKHLANGVFGFAAVEETRAVRHFAVDSAFRGGGPISASCGSGSC
ncbi:hypothetical protein CALVIDRAFT_35149 [Calocera viscosa TUFC12733]|uniref:Uncharacterized protein n=1 Tax=Calocera viscosa (strain TUFC12733) TaxID=1330018 RepID=A0A167FMZ1_CALVF|nr:hypothetical protein CALVIDRAFT_35149 [Calocera viscosa TUFC12733]